MNFSDRKNINILTSLLPKHGVRTAVVCPGSRNAPISHNLRAAGIECLSVTDERSAAFYALGLTLAKNEPVAVCVTSGTALLNLAPAVAEAAYRHVGLVVISADRPADRIGQLAGQTLLQPGALGVHVGYCCSLPEPCDRSSERHCVRLVNDALLHLSGGKPVHINVPVSEPLYDFTVGELPDVPVIHRISSPVDADYLARQAAAFLDSGHRPLVVIGQIAYYMDMSETIARIGRRYAVLYESLSATDGGLNLDLLAKLAANTTSLQPDRVLYVGDTLVSNMIKRYLASLPDACTMGVNADGEIHDTFMNISAVAGCDPVAFLRSMAALECGEDNIFRGLWEGMIKRSRQITADTPPHSTEARAVKMLEDALKGKDVNMHYANSTAIRLGNLYTTHYSYVNRGVNGIEGSLSTAAGFSLASDKPTFCVIGDLSFFYDSNALWPVALDGRLRVMLLNNGGGKIFDTLPGARDSEAFRDLVKASHQTSARGICEAYGIGYIACTDEASLPEAIHRLVDEPSDRPMLLEILLSACRFGSPKNFEF
ncbi:MAG: 2-succinyl-5-enolpyruvyl-6-hydroxy-3-cyclohexene-1-carboxylic-acid synthase [Muribaculaceae bacterium]|nr:2-succinyl-5-enolpyruvyl-6-hydroxy-3-cyclohexene-1-carboxylic-acid synthase [Muribaculaceae bacterium]